MGLAGHLLNKDDSCWRQEGAEQYKIASHRWKWCAVLNVLFLSRMFWFMFSAPVDCSRNGGKWGCRWQRTAVALNHTLGHRLLHRQSRSFCLRQFSELRRLAAHICRRNHASRRGVLKEYCLREPSRCSSRILRWGRNWIRVSPTCVVIRCRDADLL